MPAILSAYPRAVQALTPIMRDLPGVIVTIDGRDGAGKTTLGRYLAWRFNVTLIETVLFLIPTLDYVIHLDDQINRIIERRLSLPRPVIIEGVAVLQLMRRINRVPDFKIYVGDAKRSASRAVQRMLAAYDAEFKPEKTANLVLKIER